MRGSLGGAAAANQTASTTASGCRSEGGGAERARRRRPTEVADRNPKSRRVDPSSSRQLDPPSPGSESSSSARPRSLPVTPVKAMEDHRQNRPSLYATPPPAYSSQTAMDAQVHIRPSLYATPPPAYTTQPAMEHMNYMTPAVYATPVLAATNDPSLPSNRNMSPSVHTTPPPRPQNPTRQKNRPGRARGKGKGGTARRTVSATLPGANNPYATPTSVPAHSAVQFLDPNNQYQHLYSSHSPPSHHPTTIDLEMNQGVGQDAHCYNNPTGDYEPTNTALSGEDSELGERNGGGKGPNFTEAEDIALCSSFLYVCKDPIVGANQTSEAYWNRIRDHFHQSPEAKNFRPKNSLQKRWGEIQQHTNKFCGFWATVDRLNESGKTKEDKIKQAKELFHAELGFEYRYIHCWYVLREQRKWLDHCATKKGKGLAHAEAGMELLGALGGTAGDVNPDTRPIGWDAAKKRCNADAMSSTASAYIEVMQNLVVSKKQQQETEAAWAGDYSSHEDRRLALEERKRVDAKEQKDRELAIEERRREDEIMRMDLNSLSLSGWQHWYWEAEQKRIALRREQEVAAEAEEDIHTPYVN